MTPKTYTLADMPSAAETGGMSFKDRYMCPGIAAVKTGEFRSPKAGEWYLSGAIPQAYKAKNDLSTPFLILKLVKVQRDIVEKIKVLPL